MTDTAQYDLNSQEFRQEPYKTYAQMRQESPAYCVESSVGRIWYLTRYEDALLVLKDKRFAKDYRNAMTSQQATEYQSSAQMSFALTTLLNVDPPDHTRLRTLVSKAFTPRRINQLTGRIQEIADSLIDDMIAQKATDLIDAYAFPLPIQVISDMLGVPKADHDKIRGWSNTIIALQTANADVDQSETMASMMAFVNYINIMCDERRESPGDDLVSALIAAEEAGDKLNQLELTSMIFLLIVAGHETTVNLIGNGMWALLLNPDQKAKLQAEPALVETAVEEILRYQSPVETSTRSYATEDIEIGGQLIRKGEMVVAVLGSANRDGQAFPDEDTFDIARGDNRHIAFGHGLHYCLGAPLARVEGKIAINTLLRRLPTLELACDPEELQWGSSILVRGLRQFPVKW